MPLKIEHRSHVARRSPHPSSLTPTADNSIGPSQQSSSARVPTASLFEGTREPRLLSPRRITNTSTRRDRVGSTLLQSPARAGHSACMRHIFDATEQRPLGLRQSQDATYSALPDTSRKPSFLTKYRAAIGSPTTDNGSLSQDQPPLVSADTTVDLSQPPQPHIPEGAASGPSSPSWSDDSSYLNASPRCDKSALAGSPTERVREWLLEISRNSPEQLADALDED